MTCIENTVKSSIHTEHLSKLEPTDVLKVMRYTYCKSFTECRVSSGTVHIAVKYRMPYEFIHDSGVGTSPQTARPRNEVSRAAH